MAYKLSDRPKWWLPRLFKFLGLAVAAIGILSYLASLSFYASADALHGESEEWQESREVLLGSLMEDTATLAIDALFALAFLWLLAIGLDKLDQLVWLNASDEDREDILAKRKKKNA